MQCIKAILCLAAFASARAALVDDNAGANPIRKVVNLLQAMQKKVAAEGEKEKETYEKFACYCKTSGSDLQESVAASNTKIPAVQAEIETAEQQKVQLEEDLKQHTADREAAKAAIAEATEIRNKEAAAYEAEAGEYKANLAALEKAIAAISKGMAGGFLQTGAAQLLKKLALNGVDMEDSDRQELLSFLSGDQAEGYVPQSQEIVGILQTIKDEMSKSLADISETEASAKNAFNELVAAKKKEIESLSSSIETKLKRSGDLAVEITMMKNDLSDSEASLIEDQKFLADLTKDCDSKAKEMEERVKTRTEELAAIAETIQILNSDDALELFKKTLPSASASFVQVHYQSENVRSRTLAALRLAQKADKASHPQVDFIALAIQGKKVGFDKVMKMIDEMVATLKAEQQEDDRKQTYCGQELDSADDKKKAQENSISDIENAIAKAEEALATTKEDIKTLEAGISALDKMVAEATSQRQQEHEDFTEMMTTNTQAKELLNFAKNRLQKFYNPKLYRPQEKVQAEEGAAALVQVFSHKNHKQQKDAPPPAPEAFSGAYSKKSEENQGIVQMMDMLIKDLDKEMTEGSTMEEGAQKDYEQAMSDAAAKRASDSKDLTQKKAEKAAFETQLQEGTDSKTSAEKELSATVQYISALHSECDWLLKFYSVRKEARSSEIDALGRAKAVLAGADFSFVQRGSNNLRH